VPSQRRVVGHRSGGHPATRGLGQGKLPAALPATLVQLADDLATQVHGLACRLLADTGDQGQQRLSAAHSPHGALVITLARVFNRYHTGLYAASP